ncbi:hypothetical protein Vretimale_8793 [Volvox reticuliferus]|uniref:HTH myb-type domain-containing protein n=1 Tax=Volvox reticuliferus TaxID=1737510 RepID=A0A8J4FJE0_9CHLO|nr:hypothetical protein Vretifemale_6326 [Volvox reticuliferus]GIM04169.1 hypothetical protein Vretimale_8793 [Volvox reticuliferus]
MAYDAVQALQGFYGIKEDASFDPAAGLVPLTSSLIPPLVAQAFGLPTLGGAPTPQPQPTLAQPQHAQSVYGTMMNPALMGAFGFGGAQYAATMHPQSHVAGLPMGYLQALAAASQHRQQQQQQQQQSTAALLAQTAGALHAHTAALAAAARAAPATSSAISHPLMPTASQDGTTGRTSSEQDRTTTNATARTSSGPPTSLGAAVRPTPSLPFQNPLMMQNLYAAFAQPHSAYVQSPATSFTSTLAPYAVHSAYYARPPDANAAAMAAAAAAAAAATSAYGYPQAPSSACNGAFHPGYGAAPVDYSAALAAAYRPVAAPVMPAPSSGQQQCQSVGEEEYADDGSTRAIKRPRLVWTPQLHKKFETAVHKLGVEKAVPKNIMQEMNIDGLTRENVASHLQKYRMLRRRDATSSEGRDSDSRTAGTKRSEPESTRPAPAATTQTTSTLGGGGGAASVMTGPAPVSSPAVLLAPAPSSSTAAVAM